MRVAELMELLEGLPENAEVRLAQQPNWPFEYSIGTVAAIGPDDFQDDDEEADDAPPEVVVYIGEGQQLGYLSGIARRAVGWR
jgi:hypothetical protein